MIVKCPKCGAPNRIPALVEPTKKYLCGKCNSRFDLHQQVSTDRRKDRLRAKTTAKQNKNSLRIMFDSSVRLPFVHPLLFSIIPILSLYSANIRQASPSMLLIPTLITVGALVPFLLLAWVVIRDIYKSAIIASIFSVLFFYYGQALSAFQGHSTSTLMPAKWAILLIIWGVLFLVAAYFIARTRRNLIVSTVVLNAISAVIFLFIAVTVLLYEVNVDSADRNAAQNIDNSTLSLPLEEPARLPNIYYIILDRYAGESTLQDEFSFDNSEFLSYLSDKGFYIASQATSNYITTEVSLASSLNMEYLDHLSQEVPAGFPDLDPIYHMIEHNQVALLLQSQGYQFLNFGSWWGTTSQNRYADSNFNYWRVPYFSTVLFQQTAAYPIAARLGLFDDWNTRHGKCALYTFSTLPETTPMKGPIFVFAHILMPHLPFVFDSNGTYLSPSEADSRNAEANYVNQLIYTNSKVETLINELLSSSDTPPIIILQADEGPFPKETENAGFDWRQANEQQLRQKMTILNAYYFPGMDKDAMYPSMTPVNSFRLIFNLYFKANFPLLPDKSYVNNIGDRPFDFIDVTNKLH